MKINKKIFYMWYQNVIKKNIVLLKKINHGELFFFKEILKKYKSTSQS